MGIKARFNLSEINRMLAEHKAAIEERLVAALKYEGETFITEGRNQPGDHAQGFYEDKTGNLRNSIGYYIFHDGVMIAQSGGNLPSEAKVKGRGYQLIGFAGMYYASFVEAKGYNVISIQADACLVRLTEDITDIQKFIGTLKNG